MIKDESGQWILLSGLIVATSIIILALMLNQAMGTGYQSSQAILEFPKHEIRELISETRREVNIAAFEAWNLSGGPNVTGNATKDELNRTAIQSNFTNMTLNYTSSIDYIYAYHGQMVNISVKDVEFFDDFGKANNISTVSIIAVFDDGVTNVTHREVIECY